MGNVNIKLNQKHPKFHNAIKQNQTKITKLFPKSNFTNKRFNLSLNDQHSHQSSTTTLIS